MRTTTADVGRSFRLLSQLSKHRIKQPERMNSERTGLDRTHPQFCVLYSRQSHARDWSIAMKWNVSILYFDIIHQWGNSNKQLPQWTRRETTKNRHKSRKERSRDHFRVCVRVSFVWRETVRMIIKRWNLRVQTLWPLKSRSPRRNQETKKNNKKYSTRTHSSITNKYNDCEGTIARRSLIEYESVERYLRASPVD